MSFPFAPHRVVRETHNARASESLVMLTAALVTIVAEFVRGAAPTEKFVGACVSWRNAASAASGGSAERVMPMHALPGVISAEARMPDGGRSLSIESPKCKHGVALSQECDGCMRCEHGISSFMARELGEPPCPFCHPVEEVDVDAVLDGDWVALAEPEEPGLDLVREYVAAFGAGGWSDSVAAARDWEG